MAKKKILSKETLVGKAGAHLVCCDLIMQGYDAFLTDEGSPYDIVVDIGNKLKRIQVKTTRKLVSPNKSRDIYRFGTRKAKGHRKRYDIDQVDYFAFVVMDVKKVAYLSIKQMTGKDKNIKITMEFRTRKLKYCGHGKYFEDYQAFEGNGPHE